MIDNPTAATRRVSLLSLLMGAQLKAIPVAAPLAPPLAPPLVPPLVAVSSHAPLTPERAGGVRSACCVLRA